MLWEVSWCFDSEKESRVTLCLFTESNAGQSLLQTSGILSDFSIAFFSCLPAHFPRHSNMACFSQKTSCVAWEDSTHPSPQFSLKPYFHMASRRNLLRSQCCWKEPTGAVLQGLSVTSVLVYPVCSQLVLWSPLPITDRWLTSFDARDTYLLVYTHYT